MPKKLLSILVTLVAAAALAAPAAAQSGRTAPAVAGVPLDFILFGLTLLGVALFHHRTLQVGLTGLAVITIYKLVFTGFRGKPGLAGLAGHFHQEWVILVNLFLLLVGFALLARHFEQSELPMVLPKFLPDDWKGPFALLAMVFVLSSFLDNIAGALIGGAIAHEVFHRKVHLGYLAAIVAASNAGGSGSVIGDTTTTMMWIHKISPGAVDHAYVAAAVALLVFGIPASIQQQRYSPILKDEPRDTHVDWGRVGVVAAMLAAAVVVNVTVNVKFPEASDAFPFLGVAIWVALLAAIPWRKPEWTLLPESIRGSVFLLSLVTAATMMPVEKLPQASWHTAFGLGILSSVFDNIPLTALALRQGGYDWGILAFTVGFGGSMIWFGSSAGVAISNMFTEAKSVGLWLRYGWHVVVAYVVGFIVVMLTLGWHPTPENVSEVPSAVSVAAAVAG